MTFEKFNVFNLCFMQNHGEIVTKAFLTSPHFHTRQAFRRGAATRLKAGGGEAPERALPSTPPPKCAIFVQINMPPKKTIYVFTYFNYIN